MKGNDNNNLDKDMRDQILKMSETLAKIDERTESMHKWLQSQDRKMDEIIPKIEKHGESIAWLKWGVMGGITALCGLVGEMLLGLFHRNQ